MLKSLSLATLLIVALPLAAQRPGLHKGPRGMEGPVFAGLNLTEAQKAQFKAIREKHQASLEAKRKAAQEAGEALRAAMRNPAASESELKSLHERASAARFELAKEHRAMRLEHQALLTPEQKAELEKRQAERQERWKNGGMRGHRPGFRPGSQMPCPR